MRVTVNHHIGIIAICQSLRRRAPYLVPVTHVNSYTLNVHHDLGGELRITSRVSIAEHGPHRRNQSQLIENARSTYVPSVKNQPHPSEGIVNPRPQESVGVGDESDRVRDEVCHRAFYILRA